jgi:hypothetical protein
MTQYNQHKLQNCLGKCARMMLFCTVHSCTIFTAEKLLEIVPTGTEVAPSIFVPLFLLYSQLQLLYSLTVAAVRTEYEIVELFLLGVHANPSPRDACQLPLQQTLFLKLKLSWDA